MPFNNPPEIPLPWGQGGSMPPPGGWLTSYPYQRNALIDFSTDPTGWPADNNEPTRKELDPTLNYHIQGTNSELYPSDWFDWEGDWIWKSEYEGRQGVIGIEKATFQQVEGSIIYWHLDNLPERQPVKHLWVELEYYILDRGEPPNVTNPFPWIDPDPSSSTVEGRFIFEHLGNNWYRMNGWWQFEPNPIWEDFSFRFFPSYNLDEHTVFIDYVHIATECVVPEPGTMLLFGSGLIGLAGFRRRFKKS